MPSRATVPPRTRPRRTASSQTDGALPSVFHAPSTWKAAEATPQVNESPKSARVSVMAPLARRSTRSGEERPPPRRRPRCSPRRISTVDHRWDPHHRVVARRISPARAAARCRPRTCARRARRWRSWSSSGPSRRQGPTARRTTRRSARPDVTTGSWRTRRWPPARCTSPTPGTPATPSASSAAMALACAALRSQRSSCSSALTCAATNRDFDTNCPACLRTNRACVASSGRRCTTASPNIAPFLVRPKVTASTPVSRSMPGDRHPGGRDRVRDPGAIDVQQQVVAVGQVGQRRELLDVVDRAHLGDLADHQHAWLRMVLDDLASAGRARPRTAPASRRRGAPR